MRRVTGFEELRRARADLSEPVGLVPTMGSLHEGHLSLVRRSLSECASTLVSIFVNPAQFGDQADLQQYPRDPERDLAMLAPLGVDLVWLPVAEAMYPEGFQTWIEVTELSRPLEGAARPGHFRGVATVVAKLFCATAPQRAYFGQKDAQQVAVIRRMVADLDFPVEVAVEPIVREPDGLAMSSRNVHLSPRERRAATVLFRALEAARSGGDRLPGDLCATVRRMVATEPLVRLEYVSCADPDSLRELERPAERMLLSLAARVGSTRLIDNLLLCF